MPTTNKDPNFPRSPNAKPPPVVFYQLQNQGFTWTLRARVFTVLFPNQILGETKTFFFENKQMNGFSNKTQKHGTGVVHDLGKFLLSSIMRHVLIPNHWYFCMEVLQGLSTTRLKLRSEANSWEFSLWTTTTEKIVCAFCLRVFSGSFDDWIATLAVHVFHPWVCATITCVSATGSFFNMLLQVRTGFVVRQSF